MLPGDIEAVSPRIGDVHKVWNALPDQLSISIHVYGGNIGKIERHSYREDGSRATFVSGYSNVMLLGEQKEALWTSPPPVPQVTTAAPIPTVEPPAPEAQVDPGHPYPFTTYAQVRQALLQKDEIALVDVREEDPYAQSHPLFAINLPYGRIECDAFTRIPRLNTPLVLIDNGEGLAVRAVPVLQRLGYSNVSVLLNGLAGWAAGGGELFRDVNVPS